MKKGLLLASIAIVGCIGFFTFNYKPAQKQVSAFPVAVNQCDFESLAAAQSWANSMLLMISSTYPQLRSPRATYDTYFVAGLHQRWCATVGGNVVIL